MQRGAKVTYAIIVLTLCYKRGSKLAWSAFKIYLCFDYESPTRSELEFLALILDFVILTSRVQIGSRVRWWDARGQMKHGTVTAINILTDVSSRTDFPLGWDWNILYLYLELPSRCN